MEELFTNNYVSHKQYKRIQLYNETDKDLQDIVNTIKIQIDSIMNE